jgi:alpha-N-arabinofuranosidase
VDSAGVGADVKVFVVSGESVDVVNTDGVQNVGVEEKGWDGKGRYTFGKHSFTLLRWKAA